MTSLKRCSAERERCSERCSTKLVPRNEKGVPKGVPRNEKGVPRNDKGVPRNDKSIPRNDKCVQRNDGYAMKGVPRNDTCVPRNDKSVRKRCSTLLALRNTFVIKIVQRSSFRNHCNSPRFKRIKRTADMRAPRGWQVPCPELLECTCCIYKHQVVCD